MVPASDPERRLAAVELLFDAAIAAMDEAVRRALALSEKQAQLFRVGLLQTISAVDESIRLEQTASCLTDAEKAAFAKLRIAFIERMGALIKAGNEAIVRAAEQPPRALRASPADQFLCGFTFGAYKPPKV